MRVLVGPRADMAGERSAARVAGALAGPKGTIVSLRQMGVTDLSRPLSAAEVALVRQALAGDVSAAPGGRAAGSLIGYVCRGSGIGPAGPVDGERPTGGAAAPDAQTVDAQTGRLLRLAAVADHVNLTWLSPLTGPNDDAVGPRFPSMTGIYSPEVVVDRLGSAEGMIVLTTVVAGVGDEADLNAFEREAFAAGPYPVASSELVPVAIIAGHMGLRMAAVVVL